MTLIHGTVLLALGIALTYAGMPNAAGVSPRYVRGFLGETFYPLLCTGLVVLGFTTMLAVALGRM
ncbi:hypothetical protein [Salinarimonas rosea]|uniref:hypothetical protein n=1 Tax=Salinarimonas rosea TaxID=552063 RepID=UPI00040447AF|nr:hypothetical protein [Salinarimonas rosea]